MDIDSIGVLQRAAPVVVDYDRELSEDERVLVEGASIKFGEMLHLVDIDRLDFHGLTPADLVKGILKPRKKFCGCPSCRARSILN